MQVNNPYAPKQKKAPALPDDLPKTSRDLILHHLDKDVLENEEKQDEIMTEANDTPIISVEIPPWKRLLSRNLTFGSAEIVSLSEFLQGRATRPSVRIHGKVQEINHKDEHTVVLWLTDPCQAIKRKRPASLGGRPSFKRTVRRNSLTSRSRSRSPPPPPVAATPTRAKVCCNPKLVTLTECGVGDVVMVIGETDGPGAIQARIVRNVNGMDMGLFTKALEARRQILQEQQGK